MKPEERLWREDLALSDAGIDDRDLYNEDGSPNVMNAAWVGTGGEELLTVCIDNTHKIWANIEKRKAFTISVGTAAQVKACDYLVVDPRLWT